MFSFSTGAAALLASLLPQDAGAADPAHVRVIGSVADKAGRPWAGAGVVLFGRARAGRSHADQDRVFVRTNARGRFSARILAGRSYAAWAVSEVVNSSYRATDVQRVHPGNPLRLREDPDPRVQVKLELRVPVGWRAEGPLRLYLLGQKPHAPRLLVLASTEPPIQVPITLSADGVGLVPPLPWRACVLELRSQQGAPLLSVPLPLARSLRGQGADNEMIKSASVRDTTIELPDLTTRLIRVASAENAPLAGARVYRNVYGQLREIARTDQRGLAAVPGVPGRYMEYLASYLYYGYIVRAEGFAEGYGFGVGAVRQPKGGKRPDHDLRLQLEHRLRGRLLLADGEPAARTTLLFRCSPPASSHISAQLFPSPQVYLTDEAGSFEIPYRNAGCAFRLMAKLSAAQIERLPRARGHPLHDIILLAVKTRPGSRAFDLGDIRIPDLHALDIQVRAEDGTAAEQAQVLVGVAEGDYYSMLQPFSVLTDRRGRTRLIVSDPGELAIAVSANHSIRFADPGDLEARAGAERSTPLEIQMAKPLYLSGRVVDARGTPIPGARAHLYPKEAAGSVRQMFLTYYLRDRLSAVTDGHGMFKIWAPMPNADYILLASLRRDRGSIGSDPVEVGVEEEAVEGMELALRQVVEPKKEKR
ncbi:MAG: hypothetical protein ACE5F1_00900 [Planctomycetota bacterium]